MNFVWSDAFLPVIPWTIVFVSLSIIIAILPYSFLNPKGIGREHYVLERS
jgi:hypothetical protein